MKDYSRTISTFFAKDEKYYGTRAYTEDIVTDKDAYIPTANSLRNNVLGTLKDRGVYDFEDGKDTGFRNPIMRRKGADITEIDEAIKKADAQFTSELQTAKANHKRKVAEKKATENAKATANTSGSGTATE